MHGLKIDAALRDRLFEGTEARASREIDLLLPEDVWVQAPIDERWTASSPFTLANEGGRFRLRRGANSPLDVRVLAPPDFYRKRTAQGAPMGRIAEVHGNFVAIDPTAGCGFGTPGLPCQFCRGIGNAAPSTLPSVAEVVEVVRSAFEEGAAEFVYFRGRCTDAPDGGVAALTPYIVAVKRHFNTLIAAQLDPPTEQRDVDRLYAAGVDAVSYNLEIYDAGTLEQHCPRRAQTIGRHRYLEAMRHATQVFPSGTVWTELVVGVEPLDSTRSAIDDLTAMGVLPVLSIVGPAAADMPGIVIPSPEELRPVYAHLYKAVKQQRTPMTWVRDLPIGVTPLDARFFVDERDRLSSSSFYRSRLGTLAARSLSRLRRRLRVKTVSESFDSSRL